MSALLAASNPITYMAESMFDATEQVFLSFLDFALDATEPNVGSASFVQQFDLMRTVALYVMLPLVLVATIKAIFKGGLKEVLHTYLVGLPVALFGSALALAFVGMVQHIDDNLTASVIASANQNFRAFADHLNTATAIAEMSGGAILVNMLVCLVLLVGIFFLMMELIVRELMIYLCVALLPLAFAMYVWSSLRRFLAQLVELVIVTILSKFLIIAILTFGFSAILGALATGPDAPEGWARSTPIFSGALIVGLACFAMPTLMTYVAGGGAVALTRKQVTDQTPLGISTGRSAARGMVTGRLKKLIG